MKMDVALAAALSTLGSCGAFALGDAIRRTAGRLAIVALTLFGALAHAEGDATAGKTVFANQCASCHTIEVGKNGFGPSLAAVFGRKAGTLPRLQVLAGDGQLRAHVG